MGGFAAPTQARAGVGPVAIVAGDFNGDGNLDVAVANSTGVMVLLGMNPGGFRYWWQPLTGSEEELDKEHLMRIAGRFNRRVRAYCVSS
jgi:hypothetical protein